LLARAAHRRKSAQRQRAHRRGKQPRRRHLALARR
jgi:hypothetical protein